MSECVFVDFVWQVLLKYHITLCSRNSSKSAKNQACEEYGGWQTCHSIHILLNLRKCFEWTSSLIPRNVNSDSVVMKYAANPYSGLWNMYLRLVQWSQLYLVGDSTLQINTQNFRRVNLLVMEVNDRD